MTQTSAKDPVCGMSVEVTAESAQSDYKGTTYYFCCSGCKKKFDEAPEQYTRGAEGAEQNAKSGCGCG